MWPLKLIAAVFRVVHIKSKCCVTILQRIFAVQQCFVVIGPDLSSCEVHLIVPDKDPDRVGCDEDQLSPFGSRISPEGMSVGIPMCTHEMLTRPSTGQSRISSVLAACACRTRR